MTKTAVITGASSGFGASCARRFAADGWKLVLMARRADRLETLAGELRGRSPVHVVALDVRDRKAVERAFASLPAPFGEPDLLFNNAGLALGINPAQTAELDDWDVMVDTNVKGLMYCTRAVLPGMVERGRGHVINVGSVAASWPYAGGNAYGATKAFVQQFSRNLRSDLLGTRVRVTVVEPGMAETEFSLVRFKGDGAKAERVYAGADPLTADDVAEVVHWAATQPERVNVNLVEVMPTCQAWGPFAVYRRN
jgi:NADP-dependent 3-hydroxy acid dehydrogenase YdfG